MALPRALVARCRALGRTCGLGRWRRGLGPKWVFQCFRGGCFMPGRICRLVLAVICRLDHRHERQAKLVAGMAHGRLERPEVDEVRGTGTIAPPALLPPKPSHPLELTQGSPDRSGAKARGVRKVLLAGPHAAVVPRHVG